MQENVNSSRFVMLLMEYSKYAFGELNDYAGNEYNSANHLIGEQIYQHANYGKHYENKIKYVAQLEKTTFLRITHLLCTVMSVHVFYLVVCIYHDLIFFIVFL